MAETTGRSRDKEGKGKGRRALDSRTPSKRKRSYQSDKARRVALVKYHRKHRLCDLCHEEGHMRKDCPHPGKNPNWQPPADFKVSDYVDDSLMKELKNPAETLSSQVVTSEIFASSWAHSSEPCPADVQYLPDLPSQAVQLQSSSAYWSYDSFGTRA